MLLRVLRKINHQDIFGVGVFDGLILLCTDVSVWEKIRDAEISSLLPNLSGSEGVNVENTN